MTEKDNLPEEIRKKLLQERAEGEDAALDEIDLDQVAGGAYTSINRTVSTTPTTDLGRGKLKR